MKIRNGFVSNSSSSSFIVIYDSAFMCECCKINPVEQQLKIYEALANSSYNNEYESYKYNSIKDFIETRQCWMGEDELKQLKSILTKNCNKMKKPLIHSISVRQYSQFNEEIINMGEKYSKICHVISEGV